MKSALNPVIRSGWIVLILCLCAFITIYFLEKYSGDHWLERFWWFILSVPIFIFDAVFLMTMYSSRDTYEKGKANLQAGNYLIKWTYQQPEWEHFLNIDWKRTKKRFVIVSLVIIILFMIIAFATEAIQINQFWHALFGATGFVGIIMYFFMYYSYISYRRNFLGPREVIIGKTGISLGGVYTAWDTVGAELSDVRIIGGECLILQFLIGTRGKVGSQPIQINVPIPAGKEHEAEEILHILGYS